MCCFKAIFLIGYTIIRLYNTDIIDPRPHFDIFTDNSQQCLLLLSPTYSCPTAPPLVSLTLSSNSSSYSLLSNPLYPGQKSQHPHLCPLQFSLLCFIQNCCHWTIHHSETLSFLSVLLLPFCHPVTLMMMMLVCIHFTLTLHHLLCLTLFTFILKHRGKDWKHL